MKIKFLAAAAAIFVVAPAAAQTVDGVRDASYGVAKSVVLLNPVLASPNFSSANGPYGEANAYSIYLATNATTVFGYLQATTDVRDSAYNFANLYFDLDPANGNGSDLGFEITNRRAFAFGDPFPTYANLGPSLLNFAWSADGTGLEFSLDNSLFTGAVPGAIYEFGNNQQFDTIGGRLTLRIAQAFNYDVAGGSVYGDDRLGTVTLGAAGAVPEPATWAMMIGGFGLAGAAMRRRRATIAFA